MSGLDELVKQFRKTQTLLDIAGLNSQFRKVVNAVEMSTNSTAISQLNAISLAIKTQYHPIRGIQDKAAKIIEQYQKIAMPSSIYDSIHIINQRHSQFYEQWRSITKSLDWTMKASQINSLQTSLASVASQFALISAAKGYWDSVEDFEEITTEVATISERIIENEVITKEDLKEIRSLLQTIHNKDKNIEAIVWKWIAIISFILTLISEGRNWIPKPDAATKEDIEVIKKEFINQIHQLQKETNDNRITNRICKVYLKPNTKRAIATLPEDSEVIILQIHHRWVYISFIDSKDNLTGTGWVMKKYLSIGK